MHPLRVVARLARTVLMFAIGLLFVWAAIYPRREFPQNAGEWIGTALVAGFGVIVFYVEVSHLRAWFRRQHSRSC